MKTLLALVLTASLASCGVLDILQDVKTLNDKYCAETNTQNRERIINVIRKKKPDYPEKGLCGFEEKVMDRIA